MEENVDKTFREYADGSLSGEALRAFERQLEQDPDLRSELDLYLALKAMDNLRLKNQLQQIEVAEDVSSPAPFITRRRMLWTAAAASVALVLAAVWWLREVPRPDAVQLAQEYTAKPYPSPVATMGNDTSQPDAVEQAFLAYRSGDFSAAAAQLTALAAKPDAGDKILFYAGESLLQTGQAERAVAFFERVTPGDLRDVADWRHALALIQINRPNEAKPILEKLKTGSRKTQAEALLNAIK